MRFCAKLSMDMSTIGNFSSLEKDRMSNLCSKSEDPELPSITSGCGMTFCLSLVAALDEPSSPRIASEKKAGWKSYSSCSSSSSSAISAMVRGLLERRFARNSSISLVKLRMVKSLSSSSMDAYYLSALVYRCLIGVPRRYFCLKLCADAAAGRF